MNASNVSFLNVYNPTEDELSRVPVDDTDVQADLGSPRLSLRRNEEDFIPAYRVNEFYWPTSSLKIQSELPTALEKIVAGINDSLRQNRKIVGFISETEGAGTTTILLSVARFLSQRSLRILLIDADCQNPELAQRMNMDPEFGWEDALEEKIPLEDAVIESGNGNVNLLPWLKKYSNDYLAEKDLFAHAAESLQGPRDCFNLILADCGNASLDNINWLESVVMVRDKRRQSRSEQEQFLDFCRECELKKISVLGTVENFSNDTIY